MRHPEDVPEAPALVLEAAIPLGQGDEGVPHRARDRDGNLEARLAGGFGDVDEDAVLDRLGAGVDGNDGIECGGVAGFGHGRAPCGKEWEAVAAAGQSSPRAWK